MWDMTKSTILSLHWIFEGTKAHRFMDTDVRFVGINVSVSKNGELLMMLPHSVGSQAYMTAKF